ncbi:MAG: DUF4177 domain-containing protein [Lachnospiraceae bacterium]|nr:DUF4177 domain-containing protein [Lachnospiraceae bacterium]
MAKECINCGRRVGFISGDHFDGLLCDNCYIEFGGALLFDIEREDNPEKCKECYDRIADAIDKKANSDVDKDRIKQEFYKQINLKYKRITGLGLQEHIQKVKDDKEREVKHVNYAKSFNEFYEYDVVTIINENHGTIDKEKMMKILSDHAKNGWKLHTIYSNELGKNALMILGFGMNSTACEDVLIFERRIQNFEEWSCVKI